MTDQEAALGLLRKILTMDNHGDYIRLPDEEHEGQTGICFEGCVEDLADAEVTLINRLRQDT